MERRRRGTVREEVTQKIGRVVQELEGAMIGCWRPRGWGRETIACRQGDVREYYESGNHDPRPSRARAACDSLAAKTYRRRCLVGRACCRDEVAACIGADLRTWREEGICGD